MLLVLVLVAPVAAPRAHAVNTLGYLWQAAGGQMKLSNRTRPIAEVLKDPKLAPRVRLVLERTAEIKKFGEQRGLKATKNYQDYIAWDGPAVVWVVSASKELSFESETWSFPLVGSFTYLGWFNRSQAEEHRKELAEQGLDADLRGASAYSTLGYFKDPVVSTMIEGRGESALGDYANTILHESVHATYYVSGQSSLNESIAQFLADELTPDYLQTVSNEARAAFLRRSAESERFVRRLQAAYQDLNTLYARSDLDAAAKRLAKAKRVEQVKAELSQLGAGGSREINNAMLVQYKTYHSGWDALTRIWKSCGAQPRAFIDAIDRQVKAAGWQEQSQDLEPLLARVTGC